MSRTTTATTVEVIAPPAPATIPVVTNAERVYNLYVQLQQFKQQKKDAAAGFRDEIKAVENEIKDILKSAGEDLGEGSGE